MRMRWVISRENCTEFHPELFENLKSIGNQFLYQCRLQTPNNKCAVEFKYERTDVYQGGKIETFIILTKPFKQYAKKFNLVAIGSSVIAGTNLIGLAIFFIWKLLTEIWDRKEFARFQKELSLADWGQVSLEKLLA